MKDHRPTDRGFVADPDPSIEVSDTEVPATLTKIASEQARLAAIQALLAGRLAASHTATDSSPSLSTDADRLLDVEGAANFLALPISYVGELGRSGRLPRVAHGKYVRFRLGDLRAWIGAHRDPGIDGHPSSTRSSLDHGQRGVPPPLETHGPPRTHRRTR